MSEPDDEKSEDAKPEDSEIADEATADEKPAGRSAKHAAPDDDVEEDKPDAEPAEPEPESDPEDEILLEVKELTLKFGGLVALDGVTFNIHRGEIFGLIGPNGSGKTTCIDAVTGVHRPTSGRVFFNGKRIDKASRHGITRRGIARTFQEIRLFGDMTALENVAVGTDARHKTSVLGALLRTPRHHREERFAVDVGMGLLDFAGIADVADVKAKDLSLESRRRLEIARALATEPGLICLDEPAAGLDFEEKESLVELIENVRDYGYTVLLIEHDMRLVMDITDRVVVLDFGRKVAEGTPAEIKTDPAVLEAYLGVPDEYID